jgi:hypothetical protein
MFVDHGTFAIYTPDLPEDHPFTAMKVLFAKNEQGQDWYDLAQTLTGRTYLLLNEERVITVATNDAERLFPNQRRLVEVDYVESPDYLAGKVFTETGEFVARPPRRVTRISKAQGKLALLDAGLLDQVEAVIAAHPYAAMRIWYSDANDWDRESPYVEALGLELGLDEKKIDDLFLKASLK